MPQLVFVGFTNIDVNVTPEGTTVLPGGGAYFAAIAASRYVKPIGLVTRIGTDYDSTFLLTRVLPQGVHVVAGKPTARSTQVYHSLTDLTDRSISLEWGVAPDINPSDIPSEWIPSIKHVHISTMPPLQQRAFITYIRSHLPKTKISLDSDSFFFVDPAKKAQIGKNYAAADLVFVNRHEYAGMKELLHTLPRVIVKQDKEGAFYLEHGKRRFETKAPMVEVKDATGAGDIFAGTFLAEQILGKNIPESLTIATQVASLSVTEQGVRHLFV